MDRIRAKSDAYIKVFGPPGSPTDFAKTVLEDLQKFCRYGDETIHLDNSGRLDPYTTIYRDGKKAVIDRIYKMLDWSNFDVDRNGNSHDYYDPAASK